MTGAGLVGVPDPSALFGRSEPGEVGAAVACTIEGTRPLLLEIQSLVAPSDLAMPRRVATGVDPKRLAMIVAVLSRHAGLPLGRRRRLRQRRGRRPHRRARRRPRDRARDRLGGAGRAGARGTSPRSARSASPAASVRRRRPRGGSRSAASSASRRCSPRPGTEGAALEAETLRRALPAALAEKPA